MSWLLTERCSLSVVALATTMLVPMAAPATTRAQDARRLAHPSAPVATREPDDDDDTRWRWQRFQFEEVAISVLAEATGTIVTFSEPDVLTRWTEPGPLDEAFRDALRLRERDDRETVQDISDGMFYAFLVWPIAIDAGLLAGAVHGQGDVMVQMALIDVEVQTLAFAVSAFTTRFAGRRRPAVRECIEDPNASRGCGDSGVGRHASFVSGHAIMMFSSASLTCVHHIMNPWLTGSSEGAAVMCASSLALATTASAFRVMSDLHWASDVAAGATIGSLLGFGVPLILHYFQPRSSAPEEEEMVPILRVTGVVPRFDSTEQSLAITGTF